MYAGSIPFEDIDKTSAQRWSRQCHRLSGKQSAVKRFILVIIRTVAVVEADKPGRPLLLQIPVVGILHRIAVLVLHADFKEYYVPPVALKGVFIGL